MGKFGKLRRNILMITIDAIVIFFSFVLSLMLRLGSFQKFLTSNYSNVLLLMMPVIILVFVLIFWLMNLYKTMWNYATLKDIINVTVASFLGTAVCFAIFTVFSLYKDVITSENTALLPVAVYICSPFFISVFVSIERMIMKTISGSIDKSKNKKYDISGNVLIIGAGTSASLLIENIVNNDRLGNGKIVGLIDDDKSKHGLLVHGYPVLGTRGDIVRVAKDKKVDLIIFCIPSCPPEEKSIILKICHMTGCTLKTLPNIYQLNSPEAVNTKNIRNVEIDDLLGRNPIKLDMKEVNNYVKGKRILVTGGGGSIGSELCRQIAANKPSQLIIFDIYENNAYDIQNELKRSYPNLNLVVLIGSVRDTRRINQVFSRYLPQVVYHAAAHKHVPLMEDSPNEAIKNNVFGTLKTVRAADKYGVERFVLISTDKAVNPTNIMGASKRMCEMIVQAYNSRSKTDYVAVRFGNVLGSNGSVVPLFKRQIEEGGPVTVTDPGIIRFFMTIPEAVSLVLQAGAKANGGEIFVLDMGEPVKIIDLAENLIRLSGFTPYVDIDIKFTGLRPGEKKYEELLMSEEGLTKTDNSLIFIGHPIEFDENEFLNSLDSYKETIYDDDADIRELVKKFVPTYHPPMK